MNLLLIFFIEINRLWNNRKNILTRLDSTRKQSWLDSTRLELFLNWLGLDSTREMAWLAQPWYVSFAFSLKEAALTNLFVLILLFFGIKRVHVLVKIDVLYCWWPPYRLERTKIPHCTVKLMKLHHFYLLLLLIRIYKTSIVQ